MVRRWRALVAGPVLALVACTGPVVSVAPPAGSGDPAVPPRAFTARVDRVVDGDTLIAVRRGQRLRVRLIGVDAPESVRPGSPVECWGLESSRVLARLLPAGSTVRAAYESGGRRDRFDRELWDLWLPDGRFVQAVLVRRGAADAVAFRPQVEHADALADLDRAATRAGHGLHGGCRGRPAQ